ELGRSPADRWPETVYLLKRPDPAEAAPAALLTQTWRRLFRARVRRAVASSALDPEALAARVEAVGRVEFEEAGAVLRKDGHLFPEPGDADVYEAFAAVFLELTAFAPALRAATFPAIEEPGAVAS